MARILSLFSGCGGLDLGFEQVGDYTTVWANDFKHEACETFRNHFGDVIVEGDIERIDPYNDPNVPECDFFLVKTFQLYGNSPVLMEREAICIKVFCVLSTPRNLWHLLPKM